MNARHFAVCAIVASCLLAVFAIGMQSTAAKEQTKPDSSPRAASESGYWIGVACAPLSDTLRSQLRLEEGEGLAVEEVVEGSPADEAGLQRHDILLATGDHPIRSIDDLVSAVQEAKGGQLVLRILRGGERSTIEVTPEPRPEEAEPVPHGLTPNEAFRRFWGEWGESEFPGAPLRFRFFYPGWTLPPEQSSSGGDDSETRMPQGMVISITKHADEPAKITVQQNDRKWEVTEDDLEELPEDIRPHVKRLLRNLGTRQRQGVQWRWPELPDDAKLWPGDFERRLQRVERMLEKLQQRFDAWRPDWIEAPGEAGEDPSPQEAEEPSQE